MRLRSIITLLWTISICSVAFCITPWVRTSADDVTVRVGFAPVWSNQYVWTGAHPDWLVVMLACFVAFALPATLSRSERRHTPAFGRPAVQPVRANNVVNHPWTN